MTSQPKTPRCDLARRTVRLSLNHTACKGAQLAHRLCPKQSIQSGTSRLVLGTRVPSPAMSAKPETATASRSLRLSVLRTLRRARVPALSVISLSLPATPLVLTDFLGRIGSFWADFPRGVMSESKQKRGSRRAHDAPRGFPLESDAPHSVTAAPCGLISQSSYSLGGNQFQYFRG